VTAHWRTKRDRMIVTELRAAMEAIPKSYGSNTRIADRLNERRVPTKTDGPLKNGVPMRRWSGDLVRKAIDTLDDEEGEG
jgi:hypothetical protein